MTDLDALAVQVGREMAAKRYARIENPSRILAGEDDDLPHVAHTICTARAMLAKLLEMGLVVEPGTIVPPHNREPTAADFPTALRPVRSTTSNGTGHD